MLSINTNLSSLIAQNSLKNSTLKLNQAVERMSTGYKVNHAKDNAANYSIATNMTTKIGAYQVAEDNASMGLDMLTTASESLNLMSDKLSRLRALAEQAANGTYGKQSLNAINREAQAIIDEMFRTKNNTEYNGQKIFGESTGPDMSKLAVNDSGFIQDVQRRSTAEMTSIESVDETAVLAKGTYSISSAEELAKLARMQNSGKITDGSEFVLGADIDLSGYANWTPIGWESGKPDTSYAFNGIFDGNGYKISNLTSKMSGNTAGLFGSTQNAEFKNIGFENIVFNGSFAGTILGYIKANSNIHVTNCFGNNITGSGSVNGGLVGGYIERNIHNNASITIESSYTHGNLKGAYYQASGGILGSADNAFIRNCSSICNITGEGSSQGGIIGYSNYGETDNCYAKGTIVGKYASSIGGIVGGYDGSIKNCYFEGEITFDPTKHSGYAGGIFGGCYGRLPVYIENCSVKANIEGNDRIGGISGWQDGKGGYIKNCHFNGKLTGLKSNTDIGSILGGGVEDKLKVENCTYNKNLNGELEAIGDGLGTAVNVTDRILKTILQVGIYGDEYSQIDFDTFLDLDELRELYMNGIFNENAFEIIDNLSLKISATQTDLGAVENRLESVLEEISTQYENLTSSRSTLKDADIAKVSSEYIQQQILQEASATLLATANQSPSIALQLL